MICSYGAKTYKHWFELLYLKIVFDGNVIVLQVVIQPSVHLFTFVYISYFVVTSPSAGKE